MPWLHPSGGLVYHLRAWRYGKTLWPAFHVQVKDWLAGWHPGADHLVLVGPSGGYALDVGFLNRFGRVTVLEPDALARHILNRRFPRSAFRFDAGCHLARPDGFEQLARRYPDAAFLFCNLLGQHLIGQPSTLDRQAWLSSLAPAMKARSWASWHDLATSHRAPDSRAPFQLQRAAPLEEVLGRFWQGGELSIHDHECTGLVADAPRRYALWALRPGQYHVVEWLACM